MPDFICAADAMALPGKLKYNEWCDAMDAWIDISGFYDVSSCADIPTATARACESIHTSPCNATGFEASLPAVQRSELNDAFWSLKDQCGTFEANLRARYADESETICLSAKTDLHEKFAFYAESATQAVGANCSAGYDGDGLFLNATTCAPRLIPPTPSPPTHTITTNPGPSPPATARLRRHHPPPPHAPRTPPEVPRLLFHTADGASLSCGRQV